MSPSRFVKVALNEDLRDTGYAAALTGTAAGLGASGLSDLRNRNVAVSYGAASDMGGGHKEPAKQVKKILDEIRTENPNNFLGKLNVVDAPVMSYDGDLTPEAQKALKKKFLTGIDTGWGVFDPERALKGSSKPIWRDIRNIPDRAIGDKIVQRDPFLLRRFENILTAQVDGRSDQTGYMSTGDAKRVRGLRKYRSVSYGDFDPLTARYLSNGKLEYVGRAHPLVEVSGLNAPIKDRSAYNSLLADWLQRSGVEGVTPETFQGKKIITVDGATRGDTVGAKARWVNESLKSQGLNPDDYLIVGVGGKDPKMLQRNRMIANAGTPQKNILIGAGTATPQEFHDILGNSDLHVAGKGGSGPFEMLAHGGTNRAFFDDEQVFRSEKGQPWAHSRLQKRKGLHGFERKLIALINKNLPEGEKLAESDARDWMNKAVHGYGSKEKTMRVGLDGITDYSKLRGAQFLNSEDPSSLIRALNAPKEGLGLQAELTKGDIRAGRQGFKEILIEQLKNARKSAVRKGGGKLALGAGALAGAGGLMSGVLSNQVNKLTNQPTMLEQIKAGIGGPSLIKRAYENEMMGVGAGAALLGAGVYDSGRELGKVQGIARPYVRDINAYLKKYKTHMDEVADPARARDFLRTMDSYAEAAQKMSNLRLMGIPVGHISKKIPISMLLQPHYRKEAIMTGLGLGRFVKDKQKLWDILDMQQHYGGALADTRQTLAREMLNNAADKTGRISRDVASVMSLEEAKRVLEPPNSVSLVDRFEPYLKKIESGELKGKAEDLMSPFAHREMRMLRGLDPWENMYEKTPKYLAREARTTGVKAYGQIFGRMGQKYSGKMKAVGAALGALGLGTAITGAGMKYGNPGFNTPTPPGVPPTDTPKVSPNSEKWRDLPNLGPIRKDDNTAALLAAGLGGGVALGGLGWYLNKRRKKKEMKKEASAKNLPDYIPNVGDHGLGGLLGLLGANLGIGVGNTVYSNKVVKGKDPQTQHHNKVRVALMNKALENEVFAGFPDEVAKERFGGNPMVERQLEGMGPFYTDDLPKGAGPLIMMHKKYDKNGVLAHELGHAMEKPGVFKAQVAGQTLSPMLALGILLGKGKGNGISKGFAAASTAAFTPVLFGETRASMKGSELMRDAGVNSFKERLEPYMGLPTYFAASTVPTLAYLLKKRFVKGL